MYHDLLLRIFELFLEAHDYDSLYRSSMVNWEFNRAATSLLYRLVVLSPPAPRHHQLVLNETGVILNQTNLPSATKADYAPLVAELEISGFLSHRAPPRDPLHSIITDAVSKFTSLRSIKFIPAVCHSDVFVASLKLLPGLERLQELVVNHSCFDNEDKVQLLIQVGGLQKLALHSPGRAILQYLAGWLEKMQKPLMELHLLDNCGSVTPGVLRSLVFPLRQVKAFSLGLSYSLTDTDVFAFVDQLACLECLQLRHYYQMRVPTHTPRLARLKSFCVSQAKASRSEDAVRVGTWIRRVVSASPLESLRIITDGDNEELTDYRVGPARPAYDGLADHLVRKHKSTLRHLEMKGCLVSLKALRVLFTSCVQLRTFDICVDKQAMTLFSDQAPTMVNLRSASFGIHNVKHPWRFTSDDAMQMVKNTPHLRVLRINGVTWKVNNVNWGGLSC